jgi:hypothetical protein
LSVENVHTCQGSITLHARWVSLMSGVLSFLPSPPYFLLQASHRHVQRPKSREGTKVAMHAVSLQRLGYLEGPIDSRTGPDPGSVIEDQRIIPPGNAHLSPDIVLKVSLAGEHVRKRALLIHKVPHRIIQGFLRGETVRRGSRGQKTGLQRCAWFGG